MTTIRRPRVAAIGLDGSQIASIAPLCGELREADSLTHYLQALQLGRDRRSGVERLPSEMKSIAALIS